MTMIPLKHLSEGEFDLLVSMIMEDATCVRLPMQYFKPLIHELVDLRRDSYTKDDMVRTIAELTVSASVR